MKSQGWNEIARISLTHCFLNKDFNPDLYPQAHQDLLRCKQIISQLDYDDYDKLLQLADMLNDRGKSCTLSYVASHWLKDTLFRKIFYKHI